MCVCVVWCGVQWDLSIASGNIRTPEHQKESINKSYFACQNSTYTGGRELCIQCVQTRTPGSLTNQVSVLSWRKDCIDRVAGSTAWLSAFSAYV